MEGESKGLGGIQRLGWRVWSGMLERNGTRPEVLLPVPPPLGPWGKGHCGLSRPKGPEVVRVSAFAADISHWSETTCLWEEISYFLLIRATFSLPEWTPLLTLRMAFGS